MRCLSCGAPEDRLPDAGERCRGCEDAADEGPPGSMAGHWPAVAALLRWGPALSADFEERAAILEYEGGRPRDRAEVEAFWLLAFAGSH